MREIRVLIIDDAAAERRLIAQALATVPGLSVVGSAANGRIGMEMIPVVRPDVVVLDLEMPEMDGYQVLASLRATDPGLPVVIFSGSPRRRAMATLEALALGAIDYVAKPSSIGGAGSALRSLVEAMSPRIKALGSRTGSTTAPSSSGEVVARPPAPADAGSRGVAVVVIGVSTGGPDALAALLSSIPGDCPVPILIVQHMPAEFIAPLARRLDERSALSVAEAVDGQVVAPGRAVLAPGDRHLVALRRGGEVLVTTRSGPPENSCRPSVDVLFRSAAGQFGAGTLGVVLTGMGQDGLLGAGEIRRAGGQILAQDRVSSVVWGMPGHVARTGLADGVLPLADIAAEIIRRGRCRASPGRPPACNGPPGGGQCGDPRGEGDGR